MPDRTLVRRRSPVVEAVQWHKPGDHPAVRSDGAIAWLAAEFGNVTYVDPGDWIVPDGAGYRVLTPEQFEQEYERAE